MRLRKSVGGGEGGAFIRAYCILFDFFGEVSLEFGVVSGVRVSTGTRFWFSKARMGFLDFVELD